MSKFFNYLQKYIQLSPDEEAIVESAIVTRSYKKGEYIVEDGDVCRSVSFIVSGKVRTFYLDPNGTEHIIAFGIENWWVGDLGSLITQTPADFNVQCLETTSVIQIHKDKLEKLYAEVPKMESFFRVIIQNAYVSAQKRIVRNFSLSATDRYLLFLEEYPEIVQRVPQYMIASYLGITKEFLSYIRSQIAKEEKK